MFRKLGHIYVFKNIHIALCALFFYLGAAYQSSQADPHIAAIVFIGTWLYYSVHRSYNKDVKDSSQQRYKHWQTESRITYIFLFVSCLILLYLFSQISLNFKIILSIIALLSIVYTFPIFTFINVRRFPLLKLSMISTVWASVFMLGVSHELSFSAKDIFLFLEKFLFIFALTIPCDWRDRHHDIKSNTLTLAGRSNLSGNLKFVGIGIILSILMATVNYINGIYDPLLLIPVIALYISQYFLSAYLMKRENELFYLLFLDGLILVHGLIYILEILIS